MNAVKKTLLLFALLLALSVVSVSAEGLGTLRVYPTVDAVYEATGVDLADYRDNPLELSGLRIEDADVTFPLTGERYEHYHFCVTLEDHGFTQVNVRPGAGGFYGSWLDEETGIWTIADDMDLDVDPDFRVNAADMIIALIKTEETEEHVIETSANYMTTEDGVRFGSMNTKIDGTYRYGSFQTDEGVGTRYIDVDEDGNKLEMGYDVRGNLAGELVYTTADRQQFIYDMEGNLTRYSRYVEGEGWTDELAEGVDLSAYEHVELVFE